MELIIAHHEITTVMIAHVFMLISIGYVSNMLYRCFVRPFIKEHRKNIGIRKNIGKSECDFCGEPWTPRHFWQCKGTKE